MADQSIIIVGPDGTEHEFPDGMDPKKAAEIVRRQYAGSASDAAPLAGTAALAGVPMAANLTMRMATSPTLPATAGAVARGATTVGGVLHGLYKMNPTQVLAAPMEGWAAGKGGYWLGQGAQKLALPVSGALEAAAPYATALSGAAGVGDLAQMAEPNRKDIGFLGLGPSVEVPGAHPPVLNDLLARIRNRFSR